MKNYEANCACVHPGYTWLLARLALRITVNTVLSPDCQFFLMVGNRVKLMIHNMVSMLSETNFTYENFILSYGKMFPVLPVTVFTFLKLIRFARASSHVTDFNAHNKILTGNCWLVVWGLTALWDSISVYVGPPPREREKEEKR